MTRTTLVTLAILTAGGYGLVGVYVPNQRALAAVEREEARIAATVREAWLRGATDAEDRGQPEVAETCRHIAAAVATSR